MTETLNRTFLRHFLGITDADIDVLASQVSKQGPVTNETIIQEERHNRRVKKEQMRAEKEAIVSLDQIAWLSAVENGNSPLECVLVLRKGLISRRYIQWGWSRNGKHWWMDDTYYTDKEFEATDVAKGILRGNLYLAAEE